MAKLIFAGTPEFAASSLKTLLNTSHAIVAVYTQPDRAAGRGQKFMQSPVKQLALQHGLTVFQPNTLKDPLEQEKLAALNADLMIVAAYGLLLPKAVLDAPRLGCINVHASLLPRWRGASPIQRAIEYGDAETGVTLMQMDEGLDTGAMLVKATCPIQPQETSQSLHDKLAALGAETLANSLDKILAGALSPEPQNSEHATHAGKISKEEGRINWQEDALTIERKIRAFNPWPVAFTFHQDNPIRLFEAEAINESHSATPGTILAATPQGLDIAAGNGIVRLKYLQLPGGKAMPVADFLNARRHDFKPGNSFT